MKLSPRKKLIGLSTVSLCAIGVCLWGWWWFGTSILTDDAVHVGIQEKIDRLAVARASARAFAELRRTRQGDLSRVEAFFSDPSHPIAFLQTLEELGRVTRSNISIDLDTTSKDEAYLGFQISIDGREENILRYVRLLERIPYEVKITAMNYQKGSDDTHPGSSSGPSGTLVLSLRVRVQIQ